MKYKVSVLVAAYNVEEYIRRCLDSIREQSFSDLEIIIVDDGSQDGTGTICDEYAKRDERIRVIHQKNQGLSTVRNVGIQTAGGEYVLFVDGDDYLARDYVEKLYEAAVNSGAEVAMCGYVVEPGGERVHIGNREVTGVEAAKELLTEQENYQIVSWNKIYLRKLFRGIEFPKGVLNEDSLTTYKVLAKARKVVVIGEELYHYVKREGSIMDKIKLEGRLRTKMLAAMEAKEWFGESSDLSLGQQKELVQAAEIAEILAVFSWIDQGLAGNIMGWEKYLTLVGEKRQEWLKNPLLSMKLRGYIMMATTFRGLLYKIFRRIKKPS